MFDHIVGSAKYVLTFHGYYITCSPDFSMGLDEDTANHAKFTLPTPPSATCYQQNLGLSSSEFQGDRISWAHFYSFHYQQERIFLPQSRKLFPGLMKAKYVCESMGSLCVCVCVCVCVCWGGVADCNEEGRYVFTFGWQDWYLKTHGQWHLMKANGMKIVKGISFHASATVPIISWTSTK